MFTVNPSYISRVPLQASDTSSDRHVLRTNNAHGGKPGDVACFLIPGKVITSNLREPVEYFSNDRKIQRARGVVITAYSTFFDRLSDIIAHTMGVTQTIYLPIGTECVFITQGTEGTGQNMKRGDSDSDGEAPARLKYKATQGRNGKAKSNIALKPAPYTQEATDMDIFNFKFNSSLAFDERGMCSIYLWFYLLTIIFSSYL